MQQQQETTSLDRVQPLTREVLTVEILEGRNLLPPDVDATSPPPQAAITLFDSSGWVIGTRHMDLQRPEVCSFNVTEWDEERGFIEIVLTKGMNGENLGRIRVPLFRLAEVNGPMEGWHFLSMAANPSAELYLRMTLQPYQSTGIYSQPSSASSSVPLHTMMSTGTATGGTTAVGPQAYTRPKEMAAAPVLAGSSAQIAPGMPATPTFLLKKRFWVSSNSHDVKDSQGLLRYRLIGTFTKKADDIMILDAMGSQVGFIREESSFVYQLARVPSYTISVQGLSGVTARLKKRLLSPEQGFTLKIFNEPTIHIRGNISNYEFSFYRLQKVIAEVSNLFAPAGDGNLYGVRVATSHSLPLLVLAATIAIDRINEVAANFTATSLMSQIKAKRRNRAATVPPVTDQVNRNIQTGTSNVTTAATATSTPAATSLSATTPTSVPARVVHETYTPSSSGSGPSAGLAASATTPTAAQATTIGGEKAERPVQIPITG